MGDADNNFQPSKKRSAQVQLSRDNPGLDDNEETSEPQSGTFKRASDEILATRRIVKVRRPQASSATDAPARPSNPFASISLTPVAAQASSATDAPARPSNPFASISLTPVAVQASSVATKETEQIDKNEIKSGIKVDEPKDEPSEVKEAEQNAKQSGEVVDELKPEKSASEDTSGADSKQRISRSLDQEAEAETKDSVDGTAKDAKVDVSKTEEANAVVEAKDAKVDVGKTEEANAVVEAKEEEKDKAEISTEKNSDSASFSSFKIPFSGQNAFSGLTGTGFSSTSFSFGSVPTDGSPSTFSPFGASSFSGFGGVSDNGNTPTPTFSFGGASNNGNSSLFGSSGASIVSKSESKFPPMQEGPRETGEENEKAVFTADSALFEFTAGQWKERGKGELKVNISTAGDGKARLVMRAKGNYRLILNASLFLSMKLTNMDKKGITFACVNSASEGKEDGLSTIALKFKDPAIVEEFRAVVMEHKDKVAASQNTTESSPKASDE